MAGKIYESHDYDKFELHVFNRDIRSTRKLEESMQKHGWLDAYPAHVTKNGGKKFQIKAGHHRFAAAQKVNIAIKYVVLDDKATIQELEGASIPWNLKDYLTSYVRCANRPYVTVKEYHDRTGISLMHCVSLLAGASAGSNHHLKAFKGGTYKTKDMSHASAMAEIVLHCKKNGISFATNALFTQALSRILRVPELDMITLKHKIKKYRYMMEKHPSMVAYQEMLDALYNRQSQKRIPLSFLADETAKSRSAVAPK